MLLNKVSPSLLSRSLLRLAAIITVTLVPVISTASTPSSTSSISIDTRIITDQLNRPWSVAVLPGNQFLVTEKSANLRLIDEKGSLSSPIMGLPELAVIGQGGLLDVVLHPQFAKNRWVYLSFVTGSSVQGYSTEVVRGELNGLRLDNLTPIFVALPKTKGGRHFGGRLAFAAQPSEPTNKAQLFISLGDRGVRTLSQGLDSHHGSIIRVNDDGSIPADNPFINIPQAKPEIYSYGHRNVQGLAVNTQTGQLWSHEHGPQGGDELNRVIAGANYGWPTITYGVNYGIGTKIGEGTEKAGLEPPEYYWTPSIAPSGMAFYPFDKDNGAWLVGALKYQLLAILSPSSPNDKQTEPNQAWHEQRFLEQQFGRIRDVRVEGQRVFILTDSQQGKLIELTIDY